MREEPPFNVITRAVALTVERYLLNKVIAYAESIGIPRVV